MHGIVGVIMQHEGGGGGLQSTKSFLLDRFFVPYANYNKVRVLCTSTQNLWGIILRIRSIAWEVLVHPLIMLFLMKPDEKCYSLNAGISEVIRVN